MSTDEREAGASVSVSDESREHEPMAEAEKPKRKLEIGVDITDVGPCKKHLKITIPRDEIDRQYEESLETLRKEAVVPGFRLGRAPRQLVVKRFKKQVSDQVKSNLLMSSLEQIDQDYKLEPITQPQLDVEAIEIPEKGPMNFEMDVEVRPQFEVPTVHGAQDQAAGRRAHRQACRRAAESLSRRPRPYRAQAGGGGRTRRLSHGEFDIRRPGRRALERIRGGPVPAAAGDSLPGRRDRRCQRARGGTAGRHARGRSQARDGRGRSRLARDDDHRQSFRSTI